MRLPPPSRCVGRSLDLAIIMMTRAIAPAESPFDGAAVEGEGDAVDLEQRRAAGDTEPFRVDGIRRRRAQPLLRPRHGHAEAVLIEAIELVRQFAPGGQVESGEERLGQEDPLEDDGGAAQQAQAQDLVDARTRRQSEVPGLSTVGPDLPETEDAPG